MIAQLHGSVSKVDVFALFFHELLAVFKKYIRYISVFCSCFVLIGTKVLAIVRTAAVDG